MRGIITVLVVLIGSALFYVYAFWFFNSLSPADVRFNVNRRPIPTPLSVQALLPLTQNEFTRAEWAGNPQNGLADMQANYTASGSLALTFRLREFANATDARKALESLAPASCKPFPHFEARTPYTYFECSDGPKHRFAWSNVTLNFEAEANDLEGILRFVNNYADIRR